MKSRKLFIALLAIVALVGSLVILLCWKKRRTVDYTLYQVQGAKGSLNVAVAAPGRAGSPEETTLIVYLPGLGQTYKEPFMLPARHTFALTAVECSPHVAFASCDYGTAGKWCSEAGIEDVTVAIKRALELFPASKIIMAGSSMGGSTALTYVTKAPPDLQQRISGVIAIYPTGDLVELYRTTVTPLVTRALEQGLGGTPESASAEYHDESFLSHVDSFPKGAKVYVVSAARDKVVPTALQKQLVGELHNRSIPVQLESVPLTHFQPPPTECIARALQFIM